MILREDLTALRRAMAVQWASVRSLSFVPIFGLIEFTKQTVRAILVAVVLVIIYLME